MTSLRYSVASLALAFAGPASAVYFNVSEIVTGTHQSDNSLPSAPGVPCGSACAYVSTATVGMTQTYVVTPSSFTVDAWVPQWVFGGNVRAPASLTRSVGIAPAPGGLEQWAGAMGVHARARTLFDTAAGAIEPNQVTVQTWKTGSGASTVSYAIRVTPLSGSQPTYLQFAVPERRHAIQYAMSMMNYQYFKTDPERVQSRTAVDVYVDGLPVWSSELNYLVPQRFTPLGNAQLALSWDQPLGGQPVTLFLGRLPSGTSRTVAVVIRADLRAEAPSCRTFTDVYGVSSQSCHSQREGVALPGVSNISGNFATYGPDVRVYTK